MKYNLLSNCTSGGCGAKIGHGELSLLLKDLPVYTDTNLIVGFESADDASIYKINDRQSIVSTLDFFSPMINDPYLFGSIAAANALSDIYAMGGKPVTALNIVCFPEAMDLGILKDILKGGAEKVKEAETTLSGGHSIYDKEPKYGLSVTGLINTDNVIRNNTPCEGDILILTKPLGTGIIMAGHRGDIISENVLHTAVESMRMLNKYTAEIMIKYKINACTDVTGFGLAAHLLEMTDDRCSAIVSGSQIPFFQDAYLLADDYIFTAAGQRNRNNCEKKCNIENLSFAMQELVFDPQTSGGLLISADAADADKLLTELKLVTSHASKIGQIIAKQEKSVIFE